MGAKIMRRLNTSMTIETENHFDPHGIVQMMQNGNIEQIELEEEIPEQNRRNPVSTMSRRDYLYPAIRLLPSQSTL